MKAIFTDMQPAYRYFSLDDGKADVFIYSFLEEKNEEDQKTYEYEFNYFKCNQSEIPESVIAENPLAFLNYKNETEKEKIVKELNTLNEKQDITDQALQDLILYVLGG
ncbi:MAG: hypothetical protein ACLRT4_13635 [Thomasclavelia sp.]